MDNKFITYLQGIEAKIAEVKTAVGSIDLSPITNKIGELANNFNTWKAPWTSTRASKLDKVDAIANDTHSVWNSIPSGTDSVAKQTTLVSIDKAIKNSTVDLSKIRCVENIRTNMSGMKSATTKELVNVRGAGSLLSADFNTYARGATKSFYFYNFSDISILIDGVNILEFQGALKNLKCFSLCCSDYIFAPLIGEKSINYLSPFEHDTHNVKESGFIFKRPLIVNSNHILSLYNNYSQEACGAFVIPSSVIKFNESLVVKYTIDPYGDAHASDYVQGSVRYVLD